MSSVTDGVAPSTLTVEGGTLGIEDGYVGIELERGTVNINGGTVRNIGCEGGSVKKISAVNPYYDSETGEEGQYTLNVTGGSGHRATGMLSEEIGTSQRANIRTAPCWALILSSRLWIPFLTICQKKLRLFCCRIIHLMTLAYLTQTTISGLI